MPKKSTVPPPTRLFDLFDYQYALGPLKRAINDKTKDGWVSYSTGDAIAEIEAWSKALYALGMRAGDNFSIAASNSALWNFIDLGAMRLGAINVPLYTTLADDDYLHILNEAEIGYVFVGDRPLAKRLKALQPQVHTVLEVFTLMPLDGFKDAHDLLPGGAKVAEGLIEALSARIEPDDLATIVYTSGTGGVPKGVMLSHRNLLSTIEGTLSVLCIERGMDVVSALPICHVFERMVTYLFFYIGANVYYAERVETMGDTLREVKPHFFTMVPRLVEKTYERILKRGDALEGKEKKIFDWALRVAKAYRVGEKMSLAYKLRHAIADRLVFKKWRAAVGGRVVGIITGAAKLPPRLSNIFSAAGIPVREGYGQTETSPVIAVNRVEESGMRLGTVGQPIKINTVTIAQDGEILVKGSNVMLGYYKQPELTALAIDGDGWLHTGDVGEFTKEGYLKITDRKKELFKTSGGKYVAPQSIEGKFKENSLIDQILIIGENKKTVSALIVPNFEMLESWCEEKGLTFNSREEMVNSTQVQALYLDIRNSANKSLSDVEQVKRIALLSHEWAVGTGELTPTMKPKRRVIELKYAKVISDLYRQDEASLL